MSMTCSLLHEAVCWWIDEHDKGDMQEAVCRWIEEHDVQPPARGCVLVD